MKAPIVFGGALSESLQTFQCQDRLSRSQVSPADTAITIVRTREEVTETFKKLEIMKKRPPNNWPITMAAYGLVDDNGIPKPEEPPSERET